MGRADFQGVDLFGEPVPPAKVARRGRPEHVWSQENSNRINLLFATGHDPADAAAVLGVSMPTLRKHYFSELEQWRTAKLKLKAQQLAWLHREGEAGNVAAIKELFKQVDRGVMAAGARDMARPAKAAKKPKPGKKEQANIDAREASASGEWGSLLRH
ncbi:MAG: hypothetical protein DI530_12185 [Sphingomonas sp.]|uniref:hypothetical protein n=1 Tax=Sphingomonas sp. TaxID=28214 RepID=UPI000DBC450D|nr:hypothetical protein [Sphingomonas sp.]PZU77744.1 MAG: hypothetical protein DI530_12185 [Sphingomonas sp.]